jgi:hypothetical protein
MNARIVLPLVMLIAAGCGVPDFTVQLNREKYLRSNVVDDDIKKSMSCDKTVMHFQHGEQVSGDWYDYYVVEGCGQRTEYVTKLTHTGDFVTWGYGAVPPISQYKSAARAQMMKTTKFDLGCDAVDLTTLKEAVDPLHTAYRATIGARGCDKQMSYEVACSHTGYVNGKHEINCESMASGQPAKQ